MKFMQKNFLYLFLLLCFSIVLTGCNKTKTLILFNSNPITKETLLNNATKFPAQKRIYYIFLSEKPLETNAIMVKIYKRDAKADFCINKLVYSNDFRLNKDQIYYYNDYIVMDDAGYYYMAIFAMNGLDKPLATADFRVTK